MKSILEELFYGNVCPNTDCRSKDKETKELMGYVAEHHDTLLKELTDKQKETLEKFDVASQKQLSIVFDAAKPPKARSRQSRESQAIADDYATVEICYNELTDINEREIFVYSASVRIVRICRVHDRVTFDFRDVLSNDLEWHSFTSRLTNFIFTIPIPLF